MTNIWFTSDTHFWHKNIIKYCNRPFTDVDHMNETMIMNWNSVVQPQDTVYHTGDFAFQSDPNKVIKLLNRLNGTKVLIAGNHDKGMWKPEIGGHLGGMYPIYEIDIPDKDVGRQKIVLCHYAMRVWNKSHRGAWQLYGHSHGTLPDPIDSLQIDVGVDSHNFYPISYDQVKKIMSKKTFNPIDHHGQE